MMAVFAVAVVVMYGGSVAVAAVMVRDERRARLRADAGWRAEFRARVEAEDDLADARSALLEMAPTQRFARGLAARPYVRAR